MQPAKTSGQRDDVFDGYHVVFHYHTLHQQADEPLTSCEVQVGDSCGQCVGKRGDVVRELVQAIAVHLLSAELSFLFDGRFTQAI